MSRKPVSHRPVIPMIILGALGLLLLSWAIFMGYYVARERHKQRLQQLPAPIPVRTNPM